jgi:hypothetical protein
MTSFSGTTPTDAVELYKLKSIYFFNEDTNAVSSDGNTILVGVYSLSNGGGVWVLTYSDGVWAEEQFLEASDLAVDDQFGQALAISADGNTALIGAARKSTFTGAAYVFTRSAGVWTQKQKLTATGGATNEAFGAAVALSTDGLTAIIGAPTEDTSPNTNNGAAYVFTLSSGTWTQQVKLLASDLANSTNLGESVALSSDGSTAIVGAPSADISPNTLSGAAYVFTRSGTTWTQQQKLLASDRADSDLFSGSVSLSSDGNTALIGARQEGTSPTTTNGAVYVFTRSGTTWTQQQKLLASDRATGDNFGYSVSLSSDGLVAIIGAPFEDTTTTNSGDGAVYMFTRSGSTWTQQAKLLASDASSSAVFGSQVSILPDNSKVVISPGGYIYALGRTLDNKLYSYNSTKSTWDVSAFGELLAPTTRVFTSSDTFVVPTGAKVVEVTCIGGGGGGGGGARNLSGDRGGGGGGGGGLSRYLFRAEDLGGVDASITVTVGTGGSAGAATASGTTALDGNNGTSGGTTSFGTFLYAYGGANGLGGTALPQIGGAGGLGMFRGSSGGNASYPADNGAASGGGGGGGASFGLGSIPSAFNLTQSGTAGSAGTSNATLRGPGSGGNGRVSTTTTVSAAGAGGLYGGGGGGGGEGSTAGATGSGGAGGNGASGACIIRVWYG